MIYGVHDGANNLRVTFYGVFSYLIDISKRVRFFVSTLLPRMIPRVLNSGKSSSIWLV